MATVYLAQDLKHRRLVAVKVLKPELAAALGPERFLREIETAARLNHPHILPLHDSGEADSFLYYVMPYVEGESLRERLKREGQLPLDDALRIAREVASALSHAHSHDIVHRDIKPENILVSGGEAVVTDFGIARAITAAAGDTLTGTGIAIGTPGYMSPEQTTGGARLDGRSDIYSLACVLYEMLAGEPPFAGPTAQAIIARAQTEAPRPIHHIRAVPQALDTVLAVAMAPTPADRFATADQFVAAMGRAIEVRPAGPTPWLAMGRLLRARPLFAVLVVGVPLVAALFTWHRSRSGVDGVGPRRLAVLPFENLGRPEDDYFADGVSDAVRGKLTALPGLAVIARTSSMQYRKTAKTPQDIARELGVRYLLTGTVRWAKSLRGNSRVEVSPELIEVIAAGAPESRWQAPFDAAVGDVFQVQAEIASNVAQTLQVALGGAEHKALLARPTERLSAYDAYLRGEAASQAMNSLDPPSIQRAAALYAQAVRLDSTFATAWARLAEAEAWIYSNAKPMPAQADVARRALDRAIKLAPGVPETQWAIGVYQSWVQGDEAAALQAFEAGLARAPTHTDLLVAAAAVERALGRWDAALARLERAQALDPRSVRVARGLSYTLLNLRRGGEARAAAARGLAIEPGTLDLIRYEILSYLGQGNLAGAQAVLRTVAPSVDRAALLVHLTGFSDLQWLLDDPQQRLLLSLPPKAFGDDRATWSWVFADTYWLRGDTARARVYADSARRVLEALLAETPLTAAPGLIGRRAVLGLTLAILGRRDAAIRAGEAAGAQLSVASSAFNGAWMQHQLVIIYILTNEQDRALDRLEPLLRIPYILSPGWLRVDPNFAPLRGNPRFERLLVER
jgi:serine/threonine-protein kinase